jgi:Lar family restriction alleviation protein
MADPTVNPCPFEGYATPALESAGNANDGTPLYEVKCPICRVHTPAYASKAAAANAWNARASVPAPTYATWLASAAAATAADTAAMKAWIVAHPPVAD